MSDERRYDDREVGLILRRVAELHERGGDKVEARALTRGEIEEVVAELGISKALVARAVSELSVQDLRARPVWWLGGKTDLMFEEVIEGSIDEGTLTQLLEVLRRHLGDPGKLEVEGRVRIWSTTEHTSRRIHLSVVEHEGRTTLRLEERMPVDARTTVGGITGIGAFTGFMTMVPLKVVLVKSVLMLAMGPLVAVGATVGWLSGRALWKRRSARRERQLQRAFEEILGSTAAGSRALPEAPEASVEPSPDAHAEPDDEG